MAGEQMFLGIRLQLDATGVVTGAALAGNSLDRVNNRVRQTGRSLNRAASDMMSDSLRIAGALGTIAMAANRAGNIVVNSFLKPSLAEAKSFETEMSMLKFVTQGTTTEMEHLRGVAIQTGLATQFSPQEAASGIRMLKAAGLETELALESLNATLDITTGSAGMLGLQEASTATAAALLKFRGTGETAVEIMDTFAQATRETNMQMGDLAGVIDAMRDAPAKLRMTAAQALALAGVMRSAGLSSRNAGLNVAMFANRLILAQTRVSRYLRKAKISEEQLFDPSYFDDKMPNVAFHFKRLGVHLFETNGQLKDATKLLIELTDRAVALEGQSQKAFVETVGTILGPRSSAVLIALMNFKKGSLQGSAAFEKLVDILRTSPGAAREAAAAIENTTVGMEKFIEGTIKTIENIQGTAFLPVLKQIHVGLRRILNGFLEILEKSPALTQAIGYTALAFAVLAKVLAVVTGGLALATAWAFLVAPALAKAGAAASIMAAGVGMLKVALLGIGVIAAGLLATFALVRTGIFLWKKIWADDARGIFLSLQIFLNSVKLAWKGLVSLIQKGELSEELWRQLETAGLTGFVIALYQIKTRLVEVFDGFKEGIKDGLKPVLWVLDKIGRAIGWVVDIFSRLMTMFTGTDLREAAAGWHTLGYVVGIFAAIWMTNVIRLTSIWIFKQIPMMIYRMGVLAFQFLKLGFRVIWFAVVGMARAIRALAVFAARIALVILKMAYFVTVSLVQGVIALGRWAIVGLAAAGVTLLLALKIMLIIALVIALIYYWEDLIELGEDLGVMFYEWTEDLTISLFNMWTAMKNWGSKIADVFVEAFKGNFDPFFEYLENAWNLAKKIWGWFTSDVTDAEVKAAAMKIGIIGPTTEEEEKANIAGARALLSGADVGAAMEAAGGGTAARVSARVAENNAAAREYNALLQALQQQGRTVHIDKIELATKGKSNQEALRLAKEIMAEVAKAQDNEAEVEFEQ